MLKFVAERQKRGHAAWVLFGKLWGPSPKKRFARAKICPTAKCQTTNPYPEQVGVRPKNTLGSSKKFSRCARRVQLAFYSLVFFDRKLLFMGRVSLPPIPQNI
jgi:hypothetical protein